MKSVVMIAYFFPPEGSAGVYRPLRFVRQLSKLRWDTTVVSAEPFQYERYDPELLALVPNETEVIRVRAKDFWQTFQAWRGSRVQLELSGAPAEKIQGLRARHRAPLRSRIREAVRTAEAHYYLPDLQRPWIRPAVSTTNEVCARKQPDVIWATLGPVSSGVVAQKTSQRTGIPYILDFRDPWELSYYESELRRSKQVSQLAYRQMYDLLKGAQSIIFLFPRMAECYWQAYRGAFTADKIHIIPNGYEGTIEPFQFSDSERCTIMYAGTLSSYRYDTLLQAIEQLKRNEPLQAKKLRLLFVGDGVGDLEKEASALGISDIIETSPPISYADVMELQHSAHAFLILGRKPERRGHELVAGAKLFNYFKLRRPIFGVLPQDETKRILTEVGLETIADASSVSEITLILKNIVTAWSEGTLPSLLPSREACEAFSAEHQTLALIQSFEGLPASVPFVPGEIDIPSSLKDMIEKGSFVV